MKRLFSLFVVCVLMHYVEAVQRQAKRRCMRCYDISAAGSAWFLADEKTAEAIQRFYDEAEEESVDGEILEASSKSGGKLRNCPIFQNVTTNSTDSPDVVECEVWEVCTTIHLTVTVDYQMPLTPVNASFDMIQSVRGCALENSNASLRACQSFENKTRIADVNGTEDTMANLTMTARGCEVKECDSDLCNYSSVALHLISWSLVAAVLSSLL
ncbi:uncharacterized protein LOC134814207 [Bolinopsis microptera]|uniref:uncharacterized protein LOC134814207 n=1 Tax=Bolinopsis microptera TaxID=2820187 RepID=UPI003078E3A3